MKLKTYQPEVLGKVVPLYKRIHLSFTDKEVIDWDRLKILVENDKLKTF